jgi:CMP-N,N'-diacetyllegionaminic acid synthase
MDTLIIIPARAGSKGITNKNSRILGRKSLICYSLDFALEIVKNQDLICVTTNDIKVRQIAEKYSKIEILDRPEELSTDDAGMSDVILHALEFYENRGIYFDKILLLQPTSPLRNKDDYNKCLDLLLKDVDMVVSVCEAKANPYFNLFEEDQDGFLIKSKEGDFKTRQECPSVYQYNGSFYYMRTKAFKEFGLHGIKNKKKVIMPKEYSVDIDDSDDWEKALTYLEILKN